MSRSLSLSTPTHPPHPVKPNPHQREPTPPSDYEPQIQQQHADAHRPKRTADASQRPRHFQPSRLRATPNRAMPDRSRTPQHRARDPEKPLPHKTTHPHTATPPAPPGTKAHIQAQRPPEWHTNHGAESTLSPTGAKPQPARRARSPAPPRRPPASHRHAGPTHNHPPARPDRAPPAHKYSPRAHRTAQNHRPRSATASPDHPPTPAASRSRAQTPHHNQPNGPHAAQAPKKPCQAQARHPSPRDQQTTDEWQATHDP